MFYMLIGPIFDQEGNIDNNNISKRNIVCFAVTGQLKFVVVY